MNKKSSTKESGKRGVREDRFGENRSKMAKYDKIGSSEDLGGEYILTSSPDPFIVLDRKNGKDLSSICPTGDMLPGGSLSLGYSPLNLSLASPIVNLSSPPSVNTLANRLQASESAKHEENPDSCHHRHTRLSGSDMMTSNYYSHSSYSRSGHGGGSYGHHTNPSTPVGATPSYPASYQSTPCPSACPSPYHHSSANNTPYTTPYQTPAGSPISNHNTPVATPVHSPAPSPLPPYINSQYPINPPSLPSYHAEVMTGSSRSPPRSIRSYPASCPVSPATSPINMGGQSFDFRSSAGTGHFGSNHLPHLVNFRTSFTDSPHYSPRLPRSAVAKGKSSFELTGLSPAPLSDVVSLYATPVPY